MRHTGSMTAAGVLVVEDDAFTLSTLCAALRQHGVVVVGEASSAAQAILLAKELQPSAALIDLDLGKGPTGIDLAHALRETIAHLGIIFLTSYDDPRLLRGNLPPIPEGSEYLVKKNVSEINLVTDAIIAAIASGEKISKGLRAVSSALPPEFKQFSNIQIETLRLVSEGLTNAEIAQTRFISEKSVEQTISRIAKILALPNEAPRNQRVHMARIFFRLTGATPSE